MRGARYPRQGRRASQGQAGAMTELTESYETSAGRVAAGRTGSGPPLVLAHGWPWSSYAWSKLIPLLSFDYRLYFYDMPGFGQSELEPPLAPTLATQGQVFCEMLDHWGLRAPRVIAHDFGGAVSLRAHLLHGRDYAGLILMNVVAIRPWGSAFFDHVGRHIEAFKGLPPHIHKGLVDAYIAGALAHPLPAEDLAAFAAPWLRPKGQEAFYRQFALADEKYTAEIEPLYPAIRCPSRVFWGDADPWIPLVRGQVLAETIGTTLEPLAGLGHLPQMEAPEDVADALLTALEDL